MKKHANIPIFIPHLGCKNDCVFCNQKKITGVIRTDYSSVTGEIERGLASLTDIDTENIQIAYFGGSFTGIDRADMIYLLKLAYGYVKAGKVNSIRLSTRPDYINGEILDILRSTAYVPSSSVYRHGRQGALRMSQGTYRFGQRKRHGAGQERGLLSLSDR